MIFDAPNTRRNRIAAGVAIAFGLAVGFYLSVSDNDDIAEDVPAVTANQSVADTPNPSAASRDAATGGAMMASGGAIMPDDLKSLDSSQYSDRLLAFIPIETGMDRFAAKDELLVYYNSEAGGATRVSSTEAMVDGATIFVIRRSGLPDDSVSAEETFALFDAESLVAFGSRIKCYRGVNPDAWTTELCP